MDDPRTPPPPTAASAEKPLQPTAPPADAPISTGKGVKETIESILIAFVLAFIFRAFVVEAFVIPTGSMATTLLGAHIRFKCPDCGYDFTVNYSARGTGDDLTIPSNAGPELREEQDSTGRKRLVPRDKVYNVNCPNCGYHLPELQRTN